jgi:hypothetical protein
MNASLTLNTLTFAQSFSDQTGSERREVSRGVNLPEILSVKHQDYVDSKTKIPGTRSVVRLDRYVEVTDGRIVPVSAHVVVSVPADAAIVSTDVTSCIDRLVNLLHGTTNTLGLDQKSAVFVTKEQ